MPLENLKKDQHCILFSSEHPKLFKLADYYQFASLNSNLRSTCEIIRYVENYRKECSATIEIESKTAHNFHGEPVDVRTCNGEFDFVQESVRTIEEYLEHSRGLAFLPVIESVPEDILSRLSSVLTGKQIKVDSCENLYDKTTDTTLKALPSVCFFNYDQIDGLEFAVVVVLSYDNKEVQKGWVHFFHRIITRACAKLVIVHAKDKKLRKQEIQKQLSVTFRNFVQSDLEIAEPNSLVFFLGTNLDFDFITPISKSKLKNQNICLPKIEGIQHFKGPNDVIILQKEDLFRNQDVEELITAGLRQIFIVGGRQFNSWETIFYMQTYMILSCALYSEHFEIKNVFYIVTDDASPLQLDQFLTKTGNRSGNSSFYELKKLSGVDENSEVEELLRSNGEPYFKWENWDQKAKECGRLPFSSSVIHNFYSDFFKFVDTKLTINKLGQTPNIASSIQNVKAVNKINNRLLKLYLSEISKPSYIFKNLVVAPGEMFSFQFFAFQALDKAGFLVKCHPRNVKTFHRIYRVMEIVRAKQANGVEAKHEVATDDLKHEQTFGLRHIEEIENSPEPDVSQKYGLYSFQRENYEKENNENNLNAKREQLAETVCELSTFFLARTKAKEVQEDSIEARLQSFQSLLKFVIQQPIRFALEALEWNPTHKPALEALNESFSFFAIILNEIYNIVTKIEKRKNSHGNRFNEQTRPDL